VLFRQYLALIRLPNVFTAPPNVLAGYFAAVAPSEASGVHLAALMASSGLLYVAGIVLNDYFDMEVDRKERPSRPLASGKIQKSHAMTLALAAVVAANAISLVAAGPASLAISTALTAVIVAYNYCLKRNAVAGPLAMGGARFLNVILGASPALYAILSGTSPGFQTVILAAASLFMYVAAITLLSRKEVEGGARRHRNAAFSIVFVVVAMVGTLGFALGFQLTFLLHLSIFAAVMIFTFARYSATTAASAESIQKTIRNMVVSIVILDSVFVSGAAGLPYGLATLLFIVPAVVLAKKMYVT
jgi:4-hydroxybenzoate polyprenyltransferase